MLIICTVRQCLEKAANGQLVLNCSYEDLEKDFKNNLDADLLIINIDTYEIHQLSHGFTLNIDCCGNMLSVPTSVFNAISKANASLTGRTARPIWPAKEISKPTDTTNYVTGGWNGKSKTGSN